jgi:D-ribose pyranase
MLKGSPLLNERLVAELTAAGHGDLIVVADAGLPIPVGTPIIDLALVPGQVPFDLTLRTVLAAVHVESVVVAEESDNGGIGATIREITAGLARRTVTHTELKDLLPTARVVVRTGECTPFANVVLVAGTSF